MYQYLIFLVEIFAISHICRTYGVFDKLFYRITQRVSSKKLVLALTSALSGVLPIEGRIVVSTGIVSTLFPREKNIYPKLGILNYLATHHYYLWSPLEKTTVIPMAVFGLSYLQWLGLMWPFLAITFGMLAGAILFGIEEHDITIRAPSTEVSMLSAYHAIPLGVALVSFILGANPAVAFLLCLGYYVVLVRKQLDVNRLVKALPIKLVVMVAGLMYLNSLAASYYSDIDKFISSSPFDITSPLGLSSITTLLFIASFGLGSSSKFAGLATLGATVYGFEWFTFFFMVEYLAYNLSPTHKCLAINTLSFDVPLPKFISVILVWNGALVLTSAALR